MRKISPSLMNSGTRTTAPVSSLAGLEPPVAVSPRTPGSVSITLSSICAGGVTCSGTPFHSVTTHTVPSLSHCDPSPTAFSVEVLHIHIEHIGRLDRVARLPGALDRAARFQVPHPNAIESLSLARF